MRSEPARLGGILTVSVRMESFLNCFALKIISLDILQNAAIYLNILLRTWQLLLEMMRSY